MSEFQYTTAIHKMRLLKSRKKVIQGGTSSGKTHGIIPIIIDKAIETPRLKITIVAETIPAVKDGAVDIFKTVMEDAGEWNDDNWIGSPMQYTFSNGSRIQFKAFDTPGKAKASGKRDILFLNEANHIPFAIADMLMVRSKEVWIDFNPDAEFWAHTEVLPEPNSCFLLLTYDDNEALPPETLEDLLIKKAKAYHNPDGDLNDPENIKNDYWANWWRVYGMGEIGNLEGVIFTNWKQINEVPTDARLLGYGMDFGFSTSSTVLMAVYYYNNQLIFDQIIYGTGLLNPAIIKLMNQASVNKQLPIYCDSAEPKTIAEIKGNGYNARKTSKGKDSVYHGNNLLRQEEFLITSTSLDSIRDLRTYRRKKNPLTNEYLEEPIKINDHAPDAMRYWALKNIKAKQKPGKRRGVKRRN